MESRPPALGAQVLATGPPGKSPERSLSSHRKACLSCTKNSRSKPNHLQKCEGIALLYAPRQCCCWKGETILVLNALYLTFFFFPLGPCRIFSFPQYSKFHNNFPMWESVFICCTEHQHVLSSCRIRFWWQVFLSKTPVMWVLYFLNQSSDFLLFSISLSFALLGDDFFNFQPVCWVFISVIVLNFLFSSINS